MNLRDIDPATLMSSKELDVLIAEKRMGWICHTSGYYWGCGKNTSREWTGYCTSERGETAHNGQVWQPSTNPACAVTAMMEAETWELGIIPEHEEHDAYPGIEALVGRGYGTCSFSEANGDKANTLALAISRAIVEALKTQLKGESDE